MRLPWHYWGASVLVLILVAGPLWDASAEQDAGWNKKSWIITFFTILIGSELGTWTQPYAQGREGEFAGTSEEYGEDEGEEGAHHHQPTYQHPAYYQPGGGGTTRYDVALDRQGIEDIVSGIFHERLQEVDAPLPLTDDAGERAAARGDHGGGPGRRAGLHLLGRRHQLQRHHHQLGQRRHQPGHGRQRGSSGMPRQADESAPFQINTACNGFSAMGSVVTIASVTVVPTNFQTYTTALNSIISAAANNNC